jgi:hypothetical protein
VWLPQWRTEFAVDNYSYTDKKENQIFLIYKEILNGAVAKSYMTNGLLIYGEIFAHIRKSFLIFDFATAPL